MTNTSINSLVNFTNSWFGNDSFKGRKQEITKKKDYFQGLYYCWDTEALNNIKHIIGRDHSTQIRLWRSFCWRVTWYKDLQKDFLSFINTAYSKGVIGTRRTYGDFKMSKRATDCYFDGSLLIMSAPNTYHAYEAKLILGGDNADSK